MPVPRPARALLLSVVPLFLGVGAWWGSGDDVPGVAMLVAEHDVVVDAAAPRVLKIPKTKSELSQKIRIKVRNADAAGSPPFVVRLSITDGDCPAGTVTGAPDFGRKAGTDPSTIELAPGRSAAAVVPVMVRSDAYDSHNARTATRCALVIEALPESTDHVDPTPGNATARLELDVIDLGDTPATSVHESVLATIKPLKITVPPAKTGASKVVSVKVENTDILPAPESPGHEVTLVAEDGDCPAGTVGTPDFARRDPGAQTTALVAGRKRATAKLTVTIDGERFLTPNQRAVARCTALVRVSGPAGNVEPDPSNDVARLVIDVLDKSDAGKPTPTPAASATPGPTPTTAPTATPLPSATPTPTAGALPPEPADVAPAVDPSVATDFHTATRFLYEASEPIQTGVVPGTIEPRRAAVLSGRVLDRGGDPLPGVTVTVLGHPELGQTLSRASGGYDLAANGGGSLTLDFRKEGFLPTQRTLEVPWRDYALAADVVMIARDPAVTTIDLGAAVPFQVARGSEQTDTDGTRRATLLFAQGTHAEMVLPGGTTVPLTTLGVRATEYTVGDVGPQSMPAELPPSSGYTYAVELAVDEAVAAGAVEVRFDRPVLLYLENFLGFPVGMQVPTALYDRAGAAWVPVDDGRVIAIVGSSGGLAEIDTDGDGLADPGLGIDDAERAQIAALYAVGQSLWRVGVRHFTPCDPNIPIGGPGDAVPPDVDPEVRNASAVDIPDLLIGHGSIEAENQTLRESLPLVGTPLRLAYSSERVPARQARIRVPLTGSTVSPSLRSVRLRAVVQGTVIDEHVFPPSPDQTYELTWNGVDRYGRRLQGRQPLDLFVSYIYDAFYQVPASRARSFGYPGDAPVAVPARGREFALTQRIRETIASAGGFDARGVGLGGWTLDEHHVYDVNSRTLYLGDGGRRSVENANVEVFERVAGGGTPDDGIGDGLPAREAQLGEPFDVATGPDGSLYIADRLHHRVRRVAPDGVISTIAGSGVQGYDGDGIPATSAALDSPSGVAIAADGSVYVADSGNNRVRRIAPDGLISTVAGDGTWGSSGDDGPATSAQLASPIGLAVAADGTLFIAEWTAHKIRRVGPDGTIGTFAGTGGYPGFDGDGGPASAARFDEPIGLALGADGSLYVADSGNGRVRRIQTDGRIETFAGTDGGGGCSEGSRATECELERPSDLAFGPDGSLFIAERDGGRVRRVRSDGTIVTAAGAPSASGYAVAPLEALRGSLANLFGWLAPSDALAAGVTLPRDGLPATAVQLGETAGVAVLPDGTLLLSDSGSAVVFRVAPALPGFSATDIVVPSDDGTRVFQFDSSGRHLATRDAMTLGAILTFGYDANGRLVTVTAPGGRQLVVERDASGAPMAIVAPHGQRTTLTLDAAGYLSRVTNPAGESIDVGYSDGLVTSLVSSLPGAVPYGFEWDANGLLTRASDPEGGSTTYVRSDTPSGYEVQATTAQGRVTLYEVNESDAGRRTVARTDPSGVRVVTTLDPDGALTATSPDGTVDVTTLGPDPRFRLQAPVLEKQTLTIPHVPAPLTFEATAERTALVDPLEPLRVSQQRDTLQFAGRTWTRDWDATARTYTDTSPSGRTAVTEVDALGRPTSVASPDRPTVVYSYDALGRPAATSIDAGSQVRTLTYAYDAAGLVESVTDPLGRSTSFAYDAAARVVGHTLLDGSVVTYGYDSRGYRTSITPPGRPAHHIEYDQRGFVAAYRPPAVGTAEDSVQFAHSSDGQPTGITRLDGSTIGFEYDAGGRIAAQSLPGGGRVEYAHDPVSGAFTGSTSADGVVHAITYVGPLSSGSTWTGPVAGGLTRTYDEGLRVSRIDVAGASSPILYEYDDDGLITAVGNSAADGMLRFARDPITGRIDGSTFGAAPAAVEDARGYDGFDALSDVAVSCAGAPCYAAHYARDAAGQMVEQVETVLGSSRTRRFAYDAAGHLAEVRDGTDTLIASYGYDANDNRLTGPGAPSPATYDAQDRLLAYGTTSFTYTDDGELRTRTTGAGTPGEETTTYRYDALGNLKQVDLPDGRAITYLVDGSNRRVGKRIDGALVRGFIYANPVKPVAMLDGAGEVTAVFHYASRAVVPDLMLRREGADWIPYRIVADLRGSPRLVVNATDGSIAQRIDYDEFGRVELDTSPGFQPFGFSGGLYDPDTGLVRLGMRDYDAETGRFTAKDPVYFFGLNTNLYAYCFDDPVNLVDPVGTSPLGRLWEDITDDDPWYVDGAPFIVAGMSYINYEAAGVLDQANLSQDARVDLGRTGGQPGIASGKASDFLPGLSGNPVSPDVTVFKASNLTTQAQHTLDATMKSKVTGNEAKTPPVTKKVQDALTPTGPSAVTDIIIVGSVITTALLAWLMFGGK